MLLLKDLFDGGSLFGGGAFGNVTCSEKKSHETCLSTTNGTTTPKKEKE